MYLVKIRCILFVPLNIRATGFYGLLLYNVIYILQYLQNSKLTLKYFFLNTT